MLFSENINLFNQGARTQQTVRKDYYGKTALCTIVHHRAVKMLYNVTSDMRQIDVTTNRKPTDMFASEVRTTLITHDVNTAHLTI